MDISALFDAICGHVTPQENNFDTDQLDELERGIQFLKQKQCILVASIIIAFGLAASSLYFLYSDHAVDYNPSELWFVMCYASLSFMVSGVSLKSCNEKITELTKQKESQNKIQMITIVVDESAHPQAQGPLLLSPS